MVEQTKPITPNPEGTKPDSDIKPEGEGTKEESSPTTKLIDIAEKAAERMEKANLETARLFKLAEERDARIALGGESGGRVELEVITEAQLKKKKAAEFFKDTALGDAILKDE